MTPLLVAFFGALGVGAVGLTIGSLRHKPKAPEKSLNLFSENRTLSQELEKLKSLQSYYRHFKHISNKTLRIVKETQLIFVQLDRLEELLKTSTEETSQRILIPIETSLEKINKALGPEQLGDILSNPKDYPRGDESYKETLESLARFRMGIEKDCRSLAAERELELEINTKLF